ncbi:hypothetical protein [Sphingomonas montanisoli]|uniref:DUF1097 domain-containing protein n=1 Tax=Sphingomonas montanisoli TaxID=2606412 RepID=A0A5D9CFX7_9SPHN|nr:hypothetical protein [Sphingomonas montanisoli]TZG29061.1 hypothetical protein FYJ91_02685 [Sphingomonas montanisoli]
MSNEGHAAPSALKAAIIVVVLIPLVAGYMILGSTIGVVHLWSGFLFTLYWSAIHAANPTAYWPDLCGALMGVGYAFLCHWLPLQGTAGGIALLAILCVTTWLLIQGKVSLVINLGLMLFLTVCTIPMVGETNDHLNIAIGVVYGAAYSGLLFLAATNVGKLRSRRAPAPAPAE